MRPEPAAGAVLKRALDVVVATAALVVLAPVMLLVAIAVRAETPGPVLFAQHRLGRYGRPFRLLKFRKFPHFPATRDPAAQGPAVTVHNDARLTGVGRLLQRSKLDELPQFWNVLTGTMSLVGPRPESPRFAGCYGDAYTGLLEHRPGLFGPAQVLFRNESALFPPDRDPEDFYRAVLFPAKARLDLAYYRTASVAGDIGWLLRGALAVLLPASRGMRCEEVLAAVEQRIRRQGSSAGPASAAPASAAPASAAPVPAVGQRPLA
ncbi:MAG TPA: sugar transferase [Rhodospirillales bacterium]|nr:sugar transferase [Rhodospirillales bacterium]